MRSFAAFGTGLFLLCLQQACIIGYIATAPAPGRLLPHPSPTQREVAVDLDVARNVPAGARVEGNGTVVPENINGTIPIWFAASLSYRHGISDNLALDFRLPASLLFPFPFFPIPNGAGVSPIVRVFSDGGPLSVYVAPRVLWTRGKVTASAGQDATVETWDALGAELPVEIVLRKGWIGLTLTPYARAFMLGATHNAGSGGWYTWGAGATAQVTFVTDIVRVGLGVSIERASNPGADLVACLQDVSGVCVPLATGFNVPQGGVTFTFGPE